MAVIEALNSGEFRPQPWGGVDVLCGFLAGLHGERRPVPGRGYDPAVFRRQLSLRVAGGIPGGTAVDRALDAARGDALARYLIAEVAPRLLANIDRPDVATRLRADAARVTPEFAAARLTGALDVAAPQAPAGVLPRRWRALGQVAEYLAQCGAGCPVGGVGAYSAAHALLCTSPELATVLDLAEGGVAAILSAG